MNLMKYSVLETEKKLNHIIKNQSLDADSTDFGGFYSVDFGLISKQCGIEAYIPIVLYYCKDSQYYKNEKILDIATNMLTHLATNLNSDGTANYFACNFFSAPDTAFITLNLARAYKIIEATTPKEIEYKEFLFEELQHLGNGILTAGFHTPNHRWVMSAALSLVNSIDPQQAYIDLINDFLVEGIDCNEDGEYTERSAGGYNEINNRAMIILAQELGKVELLEHVRKNLLLMLSFYHDDFSIFTENSTRQDKGQLIFADRYIYQYLYTGYILKDEYLISIGVKILNDCIAHSREFPITPEFFMLFAPIFENMAKEATDDIFNVNRHFKDSKILRLTQDDIHMWVIEDAPACLFIKYKEIEFYLKGGINFFNCRHLMMQNITKVNDTYELSYQGTGGYYLPYGSYQGTSNWDEMILSNRKRTTTLEVNVKMIIEKCPNGFKIRICTNGCDDSTIRLEFGIVPNVLVKGDTYTMPAISGADFIASSGDVKLYDGNDTLKIGPAFAVNDIRKGLFGSVPPSKDCFNLYFNDTTNFDRTFFITTEKSNSL